MLATHLYKHSQNCQDCKYVKDFGEGVDRMCREMEAQGLPKPEYRQDAFILKVIVKNSGFGSKNLGIGDKNLGIARLKSEILDAKLNASVRDKILQLVNEIQINQVFGAGDIVDILKCAPVTATNLIKRMKTLNIVESVVGAGKGKYVLRRAK